MRHDLPGTTWRHTYDQWGNLLSTVDPTGAETRYANDPSGRPTAITDALGRTRTVAYDPAGLPGNGRGDPRLREVHAGSRAVQQPGWFNKHGIKASEVEVPPGVENAVKGRMIHELRKVGRIGPKGTEDITGDKWRRPLLASEGCK
ncbi:RHS repeat domain-containing protein [Streptomyces sp. NPDC018610]|uniref:RHS repeat domain-containing protein n=1 Tax=Streptomyces sp. NPDC018610 TaxID=3365049 RepID=UPI00378B563F